MSKAKGGIIGGIITLVIGGATYSIQQADLIDNFSEDTGLSQEASKQYVESVTEEDLTSFSEIGSEYISVGQQMLDVASEIDCINYTYEWESNTITCKAGKAQIETLGRSEIALGRAYTTLDADTATTTDIEAAISLIGEVNTNLGLAIVRQLVDSSDINELKMTNSYNKSLLQTALDSQ